MYYQDLWDLSAKENKYFALFATHYFTNSRYVLEFQWNLLTTRIGFVQTVSYENQSLLPILVQNRQENRVNIRKCVKFMFLNSYSHMQEYMVLYYSIKVRFNLLSYTRAQNVCPGWPVYEVKQPQEKWACDFHDDAPPLSFQLQVAEVIF